MSGAGASWLLRKKKKKADDTVWVEAETGEIVLDSTDAQYGQDLALSAVADSKLLGSLVVPYGGEAWRIRQGSSGDSFRFKCDHMQEMDITRAQPGQSIVLRHMVPAGVDGNTGGFCGMTSQQLDAELIGARAWVESVTGAEPTTASWANYHNSLAMMQTLYGMGITYARGGRSTSVATEPLEGWIVGAVSDADSINTWNKYPPLALPMPGHTSTNSFVKALNYCNSKDTGTRSMEGLLGATSTWNTNNSSYAMQLHGAYTDLLEQWADYHTWVNVLSHDTSQLSTTNLEWLLEVVLADGRFWTSDAATISQYALAAHDESTSDMIFTPTGGAIAVTVGNGLTPWNGYEAAFTFTNDIESPDSLLYADVCAAETQDASPVRMSAFPDQTRIEVGSTITEAQLLELFNKGNVDVGYQFKSNTYICPDGFASIKNGTSHDIAASVEDDGGTMKLHLYSPDGATSWLDPIAALSSNTAVFCAESLDSAEAGIELSQWAPSLGTVSTQVAASESNGVVLDKAGINTDMTTAVFTNANDTRLHGSASDHIGSNTNGFTAFGVVKRTGTTSQDTIIAKAASSSGANREFKIDLIYSAIYSGTTTYQAHYRGGGLESDVWSLILASWIPGEGIRAYLNNYSTPNATSAVLSGTPGMNLAGTQALELGVWKTSTSERLEGEIACIGVMGQGFASDSAGLIAIFTALNTHYGLGL